MANPKKARVACLVKPKQVRNADYEGQVRRRKPRLEFLERIAVQETRLSQVNDSSKGMGGMDSQCSQPWEGGKRA